MASFSAGKLLVAPEAGGIAPTIAPDIPFLQRSTAGALADSFALSATGQVLAADSESIFQADTSPVPGYSVARDELVRNNPHLMSLVADSRSPGQTSRIINRAIKNNQLRANLDFHDAGLTRFLGEMADPVNFIPVPGIGGVGFVRGLAKGAGIFGAANAVTEGIRANLDPTVTSDETAMNIGVGFLFGAALGGPVGAFMKRQNLKAGRLNTSETLDSVGDSYDTDFRSSSSGRKPETTTPDVPAAVADDTSGSVVTVPRGTLTDNIPGEVKVSQVETAKDDIIIDPRSGEVITPDQAFKRIKQIDQELEKFDRTAGPVFRLADTGDAGALKARDEIIREKSELLSESSFLKEKLGREHNQAALEDEISRRPDLTEAERDELSAETASLHSARRKTGQRQVMKEKLARMESEAPGIRKESLRLKEQARTLKERAKSTRNLAERDRLQKEAGTFEQRASRLDDRLEVLRLQTSEARINIQEADSLEGGATRIKGAAIRKLRWRQMPYFLLKNNKLPGILGERVSALADRLTTIPGLRLLGAEEGTATAVSAEAMTLQTKALHRNAMSDMGDIYFKLIGKDIKNVESGIFFEKNRQALESLAGQAPSSIRNRLNISDDPTAGRLNGMPTWKEFKEATGRYIIDPTGRDTFDASLRPALDEAHKVWKDYYEGISVQLKELGMIQNVQNATKLVDSLSADKNLLTSRLEGQKIKLKFLDAQDQLPTGDDAELRLIFDQWRTESGNTGLRFDRWRKIHRQNLDRVIARLEDQIDDASAELSNAEEWRAALEVTPLSGSISEEDFFHRIWDREAIEANPEGLVDILSTHFEQNPRVRINGKVKEKSIDPGDVRERAALTVDNIMEETIHDDFTGTQVPPVVARLEERFRKNEIRLTAFEKKFGTIAPPTKLVDGPTGWGARADKDYHPAFMQVEQDGTFTIRIDKEFLTDAYNKGTGPAKNWKHFFDTPEEFVEFVERHERAHTRLRKGEVETKAEYEARINEAAWEELVEGQPPKTEERRILLEEQDRIGKRLTEERVKTSTRNSSPLLGRRLDIQNRSVPDYIITDVEAVSAHYMQRIAPAISVAREFGDHRMQKEILSVNADIDQAILNAGSVKEAKAIEAEAKDVLQAIFDSRDKVRGTFGIPDDPSALNVRAARTLKSWGILSQMGTSIYAAFADTGNVVFAEGFSRVFKAMFMSVQERGNVASAFAKGKEIANAAGVADELFSSQRMRAITDMDQVYHKTKFEQGIENATQLLFVVNGLSHWTDYLSKISATLVIDRQISQMQRLLDGTASKVDIAQLADESIDINWAERYINEWKEAGSPQHNGLNLGDVLRWRDQGAANRYKGALATTIQRQVLTPTSADRLNIQANPWGQAILLYKTFAMASTSRIMAAGLQGKHAHAVSGAFSMVAMGFIIDWMKRPDWAEPDFDEMVIDAVDKSGVGGIIMDLNNMMEGATGGELGIRPTFGIDPFRGRDPNFSNVMNALGGPIAGQWSYLAWAFTDGAPDEQARAIRYMLPFNNTFIWGNIMNSIQRGPLTSALGGR